MQPRKATTEDIPGIISLINDNLDKLLPREEPEVERLIDSFFVIEDKGAIVGCACLEVYSRKIAEIRSVAVAGSHREHGLGSLLVQAAIDEGQRRNIKEIMVVTSNLKFFESLNFTSCLNEKYALFWKGPGSGQ